MTGIEDVNAALESRDWSVAELVTEPTRMSFVQSTRMPGELTTRLAAEAERRGAKPSELIREYVERCLAQDAASDDEVVTIRRSELYRAIDSAVRRAA